MSPILELLEPGAELKDDDELHAASRTQTDRQTDGRIQAELELWAERLATRNQLTESDGGRAEWAARKRRPNLDRNY